MPVRSEQKPRTTTPVPPVPCKSGSDSSTPLADKTSSCASGASGDDDTRYHTHVGPNDVIFGRGSSANENPGNVAFRRLVHSRQMDYLAAKSRKEKQQVARDVIDHVRFKVNPPGRFLRKASDWCGGKDGEEGDGDGGGAWCEVEDSLAMEKAKQALRRQSQDDFPAEAQTVVALADRGHATATDAASATAAAAGPQGRPPSISPLSININIGVTINGETIQSSTSNHAFGNFQGIGPISNSINIGIPDVGGGIKNSFHASGAVSKNGTCFGGSLNRNAGINTDRGRQQLTKPLHVFGENKKNPGPPSGHIIGGPCIDHEQTRPTMPTFNNEEVGEQKSGYEASCDAETFGGENSMTSFGPSSQVYIGPCADQEQNSTLPSSHGGTGIAPGLNAAFATESLHGENELSLFSGLCDATQSAPACPAPDPATAPAPQNMTLKEWVTLGRPHDLEHSTGYESLLETWVRLALDISRSVRDCHANALTFNGTMTSNDIRVLWGLESVSFYGLDLNAGASTGQQAARADLVSFGRVLYELFAGTEPYCDQVAVESNACAAPTPPPSSLGALSVDESRARKKRQPQTAKTLTPIRDLGLPSSLCMLVTSLLDAEDGGALDRYNLADEIEEDLRLMVTNPKQCLFDGNAGQMVARLRERSFGKLYGRDAELATLMKAFDRVICTGESSCEFVLIKGYSGTGKTTLAQQLKDPLIKRKGYFIAGKFDQMSRTQPLSAVVAALNDYCNDLVSRDDICFAEISAAVKEFVGSDGKALVNLIPNLSKVIGMTDPLYVETGCVEAMNRLVFFFRMFARAISKPSHPVIFFLDDLQWADEASLEILRMLSTDREVQSLLFVGCYRDNEVGTDHPLMLQQGKLVSSGVNVETISIGNIDKESVNALISDSLHLLPRLTEALTATVYNKTGGNVLFLCEFLGSLLDEGLLHFSPLQRRWKWDMQAVQSRNVADNVADFVTKNMLLLDKHVQDVLRKTACLGAQSEEVTLKILFGLIDEHKDAFDLLEVAENEGILYKVGAWYKFSHDQIQLAAYALTPEDERTALHLEIGQHLIRAASEEQLDKFLFIFVDQMNRGQTLITDHGEKIDLALLNRKAGEKAIASSSFLAASTYLKFGIELLEEEDWETNYFLCLQLYSSCAETEYTLGNFDRMKSALDNIFSHAKVFKDKLRAYYTLLCSLGAQECLQEAIECGLEVLCHLGERFPKHIDRSVIIQDLMQTKEALSGRSEEALSNMNVMEDERAIAAMKFLNRLSLYVFTGKQEFVPLIASRMVRLSLAHGVCRESAFGYALYGMVCCISAGDHSRGYRFGKVALSLLERFQANEHLARVYAVVYGCINVWIEPIQVILPSHLSAYGVGLMTGDPEYAMMNIQIYLSVCFTTGTPLAQVAKDCEEYSREMLEHKQEIPALMIQPLWQATLNLMGRSKNPLALTGEAMDEEAFLWEAQEKGHCNAYSRLYLLQMWLAYLFGEYDLAARHMQNCENFQTKLMGHGLCIHTFNHGLASLALARKTQDKKWVEIGNRAIDNFTTWASSAPWNCQHRLELLNAEYAFSVGDTAKAAKAYDDAIDLASKHSFISDKALALERAAIFYSEAGDNPELSAEYYSKAQHFYLKWGARRKAEDIEHICTSKDKLLLK